ASCVSARLPATSTMLIVSPCAPVSRAAPAPSSAPAAIATIDIENSRCPFRFAACYPIPDMLLLPLDVAPPARRGAANVPTALSCKPGRSRCRLQILDRDARIDGEHVDRVCLPADRHRPERLAGGAFAQRRSRRRVDQDRAPAV